MKIPSAYLFVIAASVIWGATPAIMKLTLTEIPIFTLAFIRMFLASVILFFVVHEKLHIKKGDFYKFVALALTGVTLNVGLFFLGLTLTKAINAAFLTPAVPILTIVAAHLYLKEKFEPKIIVAGIIALVGILIVVNKPMGAQEPLEMFGNLLLLASALAWVFHEIIAKKLLKVYDSGTVAFYAMFIGAFTFLPMYLYELAQNPTWISNVSPTGLLGLAYGIFFASLIAYWAWQKGLKKLPAGQAAFFFYLDPVTGGIFSYLLLGEKITTPLVIGGALITLAVILAEYRRKNHPLHKKYRT